MMMVALLKTNWIRVLIINSIRMRERRRKGTRGMLTL